ncbi:hypothetical protein MOOR_17890 [Moorella thermoacetica]|uniref:Uncharacterized protein n=1 Tax=Neomoorella thermoacetica TaxID=1525 RepID=A0A1J5JYK6_NEOTH|nr:hypothetical protein MOOR_17890 [Moorella thermoacetica]
MNFSGFLAIASNIPLEFTLSEAAHATHPRSYGKGEEPRPPPLPECFRTIMKATQI